LLLKGARHVLLTFVAGIFESVVLDKFVAGAIKLIFPPFEAALMELYDELGMLTLGAITLVTV